MNYVSQTIVIEREHYGAQMGGKDLHSSGIANNYPEGSVVGVNWHKAKGGFEIRFGHEYPRALGAQKLHSIVHSHVHTEGNRGLSGCDCLCCHSQGKRGDTWFAILRSVS